MSWFYEFVLTLTLLDLAPLGLTNAFAVLDDELTRVVIFYCLGLEIQIAPTLEDKGESSQAFTWPFASAHDRDFQ